jgi:hypothetical protein
MSSTADGFSGRSLTVVCGTGFLCKFRALNIKVYVIVHVFKLQSEICGAYTRSYNATEGMGCISIEGTERKWIFPRWGRRQVFSLTPWPICVIRQCHFQEYNNLPLRVSRTFFKYVGFEEKLCEEDPCNCPPGILTSYFFHCDTDVLTVGFVNTCILVLRVVTFFLLVCTGYGKDSSYF